MAVEEADESGQGRADRLNPRPYFFFSFTFFRIQARTRAPGPIAATSPFPSFFRALKIFTTRSSY